MINTERIAIALDIENLVGPPPAPTPSGIVQALEPIIGSRKVVSAVGFCAVNLRDKVVWELDALGVRVFGHRSAERDAADRLLLNHLAHGLPASITTVVIGSGDHIFATAASDLLRRGLRVEVFARPGTIAADLYRRASMWHPIAPITSQVDHLIAA